ncbi:hypothetical protein MXB_3377 [Myxobolus squamalis]|nr:hypothetical protein MXB_3377 [Myxobolus squamalis]
MNAKLTKQVKYSEFDDSWYSFIQSIAARLINLMKSLVCRNCEKMEFPQICFTALNNYEYIADVLKSNVFMALFPKDYSPHMVSILELSINKSVADYID